MSTYILNTLTHWHLDTLTPWHLDTLTPWHHDTLTPWHHDTLTPWHRDTLTPWHHDTLTHFDTHTSIFRSHPSHGPPIFQLVVHHGKWGRTWEEEAQPFSHFSRARIPLSDFVSLFRFTSKLSLFRPLPQKGLFRGGRIVTLVDALHLSWGRPQPEGTPPLFRKRVFSLT